MFTISEILGWKIDPQGTLRLKVRWAGFDPADDTRYVGARGNTGS